MSKLHGKLVIDRQLADDDLWLAEPFSRAQALFDLSLLANDTDRETRSRGIPVCLSRGQVGRSVSSLAERWQWSKDKTRRFFWRTCGTGGKFPSKWTTWRRSSRCWIMTF